MEFKARDVISMNIVMIEEVVRYAEMMIKAGNEIGKKLTNARKATTRSVFKIIAKATFNESSSWEEHIINSKDKHNHPVICSSASGTKIRCSS